MFAVFGKQKKKEYEKSFNKLGVKVQDEEKTFAKDTGCYQISGDFFIRKDSYGFCGTLQRSGRFYTPCLYSNSQASS